MDAFFLLTSSDEVLLQRYYRTNTPLTLCQEFINVSRKFPGEDVHELGSNRACATVTRDQLKFVAVVSQECSTVFILDCLHTIADNVSLYFEQDVNESVIKENYSTVLILIEEMLDFGLPSMIDSNALLMLLPSKTLFARAMEFISPTKIFSGLFNTGGNSSSSQPILSSHIAASPGDGMGAGSGMGALSGILGSGSSIWWRRGNAAYLSDEIHVDVLENLNFTVGKTGKVLNSFLNGQILIRCHLSGMPNCQLILRNPDVLGTEPMASFHPSVNLNKWKDERAVFFVPPDGLFTLCDYSLQVPLVPPVILSVNFAFPQSSTAPEIASSLEGRLGKFEILLVPRADFSGPNSTALSSDIIVLEKVKFSIPLPHWVSGVTVGETSIGIVKFTDHCIIWTIARLPLDPTRNLQCEGTIELETTTIAQLQQNGVATTKTKSVLRPDSLMQEAEANEEHFANDFTPAAVTAEHRSTPQTNAADVATSVESCYHTVRPKDLNCVAEMQFLVRDWVASGLVVDSLEVMGHTQTSSGAFKGVRKTTTAGSVEFRV